MLELASAMFRIAVITQPNQDRSLKHSLPSRRRSTFLRSLLEQYPEDVSIMRILSRSLTLRGKSLVHLDRMEEAIRSHDEAFEVWSHLPEGGANQATAQCGLRESR